MQASADSAADGHARMQRRLATLEAALADREASVRQLQQQLNSNKHGGRGRTSSAAAGGKFQAPITNDNPSNEPHQMQRQMAEYRGLVAQLQQQLLDREVVASRLQRRVPELEATISQLQADLLDQAEDLGTTVSRLQAQVRDRALERDEAEAAAKRLERRVSDLQGTVSQLQAELRKEVRQREAADDEARSQSIPTLEATITQLREQLRVEQIRNAAASLIDSNIQNSVLALAGDSCDLTGRLFGDMVLPSPPAALQHTSSATDRQVTKLQNIIVDKDRELAEMRSYLTNGGASLQRTHQLVSNLPRPTPPSSSTSAHSNPDAELRALQLQCILDAKDREIADLRARAGAKGLSTMEAEHDEELAMADREIAALQRRIASLEGELLVAKSVLLESGAKDGDADSSAASLRADRCVLHARSILTRTGVQKRQSDCPLYLPVCVASLSVLPFSKLHFIFVGYF